VPILDELHVQQQDYGVDKWDGKRLGKHGRRGNTTDNASHLRVDPLEISSMPFTT
jgi:hypothetical protein